MGNTNHIRSIQSHSDIEENSLKEREREKAEILLALHRSWKSISEAISLYAPIDHIRLSFVGAHRHQGYDDGKRWARKHNKRT